MKLKAFLESADRTPSRAQKYPFGGWGLLYHTRGIDAGYSGDPSQLDARNPQTLKNF
jgi:hypothetical protein